MIVSIVHKGLKQLWLKDDPSRLPAEQVNKIRRILEAFKSDFQDIDYINLPER